MQMSNPLKAMSGIVGFALLVPAIAGACDEVVRDAAFNSARNRHQLCVMAHRNDPPARMISEDLIAWLKGPGRDLNLDSVFVDADDPQVVWTDYGIPSAPPQLPVVVLVGHNPGSGKRFVIDHWEPGPNPEELAALLTSPVRRKIHDEVGKSLALMLFSPAIDSDGLARTTLNESVAKWSDVETLGITIVELDRSDPRERILLSFAGIRPDGPDWMGMVFGRGKLMSPPLEGEDISKAAIDELIEQVALDCSCSKPVHTLGVDIPLAWNDQSNAEVVYLKKPSLEGDSEKLASLLPSLADQYEDRPQLKLVRDSTDDPAGTVESSDPSSADAGPNDLSQHASTPIASGDAAPSISTTTLLTTTLSVLVGALVIVAGFSLFFMRRSN
jgi:hypothetical protein